MFKDYKLKNYNLRIVLYVFLLSVIGVLLIRSATMDNIDYEMLPKKQIFGIAVGMFMMLVLSLFQYKYLFRLAPLIYILNMGLLLATRLMGDTNLGAQRWLVLPVIGSIQPSEFSKIAIVITLAAVIYYRRESINSPITWLFILLVVGPPLLLIYKQPDLSTTILILAVILIMIYVGKLSYRIIGVALLLMIPFGIWFFYTIMQEDQTLLEPYQVKRIMSFIDPEKYQDSIYQQENSIMAIGSGGFWGKGLNTTSFESVKNGNYLSEAHTDFIFTIAGEELGFVGCIGILLLFLLIITEALMIAKNADTLGGRLICVGMAGFYAFQMFIHVAVTTWMMPNTGLPMPFVSYGLSSIISSYMGIGLILNVGLQRKKKEKKQGIFNDLS